MCSVRLHDLAYFIKTIQENAINLARGNHDIFDVKLCSAHKISQFLLCLVDLVLILTSDEDFISCSSGRALGNVTEDVGERGREIDGSLGGRFDQFDVLSSSSGDQGMHGQFELHDINLVLELPNC